MHRVGLEPTLPFPVQIKSLLHNLSANDAYKNLFVLRVGVEPTTPTLKEWCSGYY